MSTVRYTAVTKHYGATIAVHEFDLEVADKEFVTLLGPSGCGKTTTLRMTAGLIQPSSGRIWFDGRDVTNLPPRSRNIGFVFQTPALFPHLTVADNIAFGLSVKGQKKAVIAERVEEMLKLVELAGYGRRLPGQLSGGQQQRVALARVLATDPTVLLFDEPLSALDKNLRDTLKYSILELQRRTAKTAIYVTHDQSEAFAISDRIVVMNGGHIEQIGTQTEIYLQPRTAFVAEFIGANNALPGTVTAVESGPTDAEGSALGGDLVTVASGELTLRCRGRSGLEVGDAVVAYLRPEAIRVLDEGEPPTADNVVSGDVERTIFEGATAQLRVRVGGRPWRVDIGGGRRLTVEGRRTVRLQFDDLTVIRTGGDVRRADGDPDRGPAAPAEGGGPG
jgi:ABC-type Fe3+/spermidine/putrescine transport system ATPase subunit